MSPQDRKAVARRKAAHKREARQSGIPVAVTPLQRRRICWRSLLTGVAGTGSALPVSVETAQVIVQDANRRFLGELIHWHTAA